MAVTGNQCSAIMTNEFKCVKVDDYHSECLKKHLAEL